MNIPDTKDFKYLVYTRKSSEQEDKQVTSIEDQLKETRKLSAGLNVQSEIKEERSAKTLGRPLFAGMIEQIKKGKIQGIVTWKINRLARNPIDGGEIIWLLQKGTLKHIKTTDGDYYPDSDMMLLYIHFGMAHQFSLNLSKDVKRGLLSKAEKGHRPSLTPLGYLNSKSLIKGQETVLNDDARHFLVKKVFQSMLTGQYNVHQILKFANEELRLVTRKGQKMSKSNMYGLLSNPFYYGRYEYPKGSGNWHQGKYEPIITKQQFDKIQYLLGRAGGSRPHDHIFAYTGLMKCGECGARITCEQKWKHQKNGNVHSYIYYHCTGRVNPNCTQKSIEEKTLEKQIEHFLSSIEITPEFHTWAIEEIKAQHEAEKKDRNKILYTQQRDYDLCVASLDSLTDMRINKEIDAEDFARRKSVLEHEKSSLKSLLDGVDKRIDDWLQSVEQTLTFAEKARVEFGKGNLYKRKQILTALGHNHILKDKILVIETEKPLQLIPEASFQYKLISERLEPLNGVGTKGQNRQTDQKSSLLWEIQDSNL